MLDKQAQNARVSSSQFGATGPDGPSPATHAGRAGVDRPTSADDDHGPGAVEPAAAPEQQPLVQIDAAAAKPGEPASDQGTVAAIAEQFGAARLLLADLRFTWVLINEGRYRALGWLGVPRQDANLATLILTGVAADAAHRQLRRLRPAMPARQDVLLGVGVGNEVLLRVAGPGLRRAPYLGALIAVALVSTRSGTAVRESLHGVVSVSRSTARAFHQRYGDLLPARAKPGQS